MINKLLIILVISGSVVFPQTKSLTESLDKIQSSAIKGVTEGLSWHDLLLTGYMLSRNNIHIEDDDKLSVRPSSFESNIQDNIGRNGRVSVGSLDPNYFPNIIFYSRLAFTVGKNIFDPSSTDKDDYKHIFLFGKSILYTFAITDITKETIGRKRPDGSDTKSFFSGHTSTAFATSSFLYREIDDYLDSSPMTANNDVLRKSLKAISFLSLYGWAGYVGYSRMQDNKHYLSDVIVGAAVGTIISNVIYDFYLNEDAKILKNVNVGIVDRTPVISFRMDF
ncbi:MAG: phosphatase PAP2 family protein [Ignavibacteriales bacterium]|nr:MAG: phosphatase PAP2 family protein [Ignavibacteriales bacterium]